MRPTTRQRIVAVGYFGAVLIFGVFAIASGRSSGNPVIVVLGVIMVAVVIAMIPATIVHQVRLRRRRRDKTPASD